MLCQRVEDNAFHLRSAALNCCQNGLALFSQRGTQPVKNAKDLVAISKRLKPNAKILIRVWSQGRSGFVALEPK